MKRELLLTFLLVQGGAFLASGFSTSSSLPNASPSLTLTTKRSPATTSALFVAITASSGENTDVDKVVDEKELKKKEDWKRIRKEGGFLTFNTPIGALNPFAIYYGLTSILLGIPWFISLKIYQLLQFITRERFDKKVSHGGVHLRMSRLLLALQHRQLSWLFRRLLYYAVVLIWNYIIVPCCFHIFREESQAF